MYLNEKEHIHLNDDLLHPITWDDLILAAQNDRKIMNAASPKIREELVVKLFMKLAAENKTNAYDQLRSEIGNVMNFIVDEDGVSCDLKWRDVAISLALKIFAIMEEYGINPDCNIYAAGKRFSMDRDDRGAYKPVQIEDNVSPYEYTEYCRVLNILLMTFDGEVYEAFNYDGGDRLYEFCHDVEELLREHGLFYELGEPFNLSVYPIFD